MAKTTTISNDSVLESVQKILNDWAVSNGTAARADLNLGSARHIVVSETAEEETED